MGLHASIRFQWDFFQEISKTNLLIQLVLGRTPENC